MAHSEGGDKKLLAVNLAADDKAAATGFMKRQGFGASVEAPKELHGPPEATDLSFMILMEAIPDFK